MAAPKPAFSGSTMAGSIAAIGARSVRRAGERWFELRYGIETSGFSYHDEDDPARCDDVWYHPSEWFGLRRALRRLRPTGSDTLVDMGAGRGRAVLVAATMPFGRVIGVEMDEGWAQIAREALERNRRRLKCQNVEVVAANVLQFDVPDETTIVYLYCPFVGDVFQRFAERMLDFVDRVQRPVRMVYNYPFEHNRLIALQRFDVVDVCPANWPARDLRRPEVAVTYLIQPRSSAVETASSAVAGAALEGAASCWRGPYDPGFVLKRDSKRIFRSTPNWRPRD
jgi:precorrin-6B methylase 2